MYTCRKCHHEDNPIDWDKGGMTMKGEWKVASIYAAGLRLYQIYRLRDVNATDHSGNREYTGPVFGSEAEAKIWLQANKGGLPE